MAAPSPLLTYVAAAAVPAGVAVALVDFDLAVFAGVAGPAGARIAALTGVGARGAVLARLVVGAVIQVCSEERRLQQTGNNNNHNKRRGNCGVCCFSVLIVTIILWCLKVELKTTTKSPQCH